MCGDVSTLLAFSRLGTWKYRLSSCSTARARARALRLSVNTDALLALVTTGSFIWQILACHVQLFPSVPSPLRLRDASTGCYHACCLRALRDLHRTMPRRAEPDRRAGHALLRRWVLPTATGQSVNCSSRCALRLDRPRRSTERASHCSQAVPLPWAPREGALPTA